MSIVQRGRTRQIQHLSEITINLVVLPVRGLRRLSEVNLQAHPKAITTQGEAPVETAIGRQIITVLPGPGPPTPEVAGLTPLPATVQGQEATVAEVAEVVPEAVNI